MLLIFPPRSIQDGEHNAPTINTFQQMIVCCAHESTANRMVMTWKKDINRGGYCMVDTWWIVAFLPSV